MGARERTSSSSEVAVMDSALKVRKHLTPPRGMHATSVIQEKRREIRREVSERVELKGSEGAFEGWTLNVSRGGVRVIVERELELGDLFEVTVGLAQSSPLVRQGRVVWFQEEADGFIAGIAFVAADRSPQSRHA
jgi:PilZ domain